MRFSRPWRGLQVAAWVLLGIACSKAERSERSQLDGAFVAATSNPTAGGPCQTGLKRECSVTLSEHNGVLNCFRGQQVCVEGQWSTCGDGQVQSLPAASALASKGLTFKAVGTSVACEANPCDPSCLQLRRQGDADAGVATALLVEGVGEFQWQTGRLSDFPNGLVKKGLVEPCSSGDDCQFNTRCEFPVSGSCAHSKCQQGEALVAECDPCVTDICEGNPECCAQPEAQAVQCSHDPCQQGAALDSTCDACVSTICAAQPTCCTEAWTAECTAAVATRCGGSCACGAGEQLFEGSCYAKEETDRDWSDARTACQQRGEGWDLVSIATAEENDFVVDNVLDDSSTWLGMTDGNGLSTEGRWVWSNSDPAGVFEQSASGSGQLVPFGAQWRYDATGVDPGGSWMDLGFDDSAWLTGPAQFGYGERDEATVVFNGGASYYFRHEFNLASLPSATSLEILFDDGFVAYLNGVEIGRGEVVDATHGSFASSFTANGRLETIPLTPSQFVLGDNVLAIVVKNGSPFSNDLSFDAELTGTVSGGASLFQNFDRGEPGRDSCAQFRSSRRGSWEGESCSRRRDSVCEGPPSEMVGSQIVPSSGAFSPIETGSSWLYDDTGVDPGSTWMTPDFDDSAWASGPSQLGFGDGDEATELSSVRATYYFRRTFPLTSEVSSAEISLVFDDGFVVYVNGVLVDSRNLFVADHSSFAGVSSNDNERVQLTVDPSLLQVGDNTVAVMLKNRFFSPDASFDLTLDVNLCGAQGCPADPAWSEACVGLVQTVCAARCDTRQPPSSSGQCVARNPGEVDASCSGIDLAVGVPCDENVPICNHGSVEAPAGVRVIHYPGNSGHYPTCEPDQSHPQMKTCVVDRPIPPGECVSLTDCEGLKGNREIMVNPPSSEQVSECSCRDNWGLYSGVSCSEPVCEARSSVATLVTQPVDIVFVIDNSGSMGGEIVQVQKRINEDFAQIIEDSGVDYRVIMVSRYGDVGSRVGSSSFPICVASPLGGHNCNNPSRQDVANNPGRFYHYSADIGSHDALCRILEGFSRPDELASDRRSWTPQLPSGYGAVLRPEARKAFVVISDDDVSCSFGANSFRDNDSVISGASVALSFDAALRNLSPEQFGTLDDRNYVFHSIVGMSENSVPDEPWPATASVQTGRCSPGSVSPGTGYQALSTLTGGLRYPSCRNDDFDAIFNALAEQVVEGAVASCSIALDNSESVDSSKMRVTYSPGDGGIAIPLTAVAGEPDCTVRSATSYYFEEENTVTLCPAACTVVQADLTGALAVEVGCLAGQEQAPRQISEVYESGCSEDAEVQWSFLTYNSTTPLDSSIVFKVRAARTEEALEDAEFVEVATAQALPDTQACTPAGPSPCPIDLFNVLDPLGLAHAPFIELDILLQPSATAVVAPTIQNWELTYSCPFAL